MNWFAIGFVAGAWLLQQQSALPSLYSYAAILPIAFLAFRIANFQKICRFGAQSIRIIQALSLFICALLLGFYWSAGFAQYRLNDALSKEWQQKNVEIVGVIATLPEQTERGERFKFDVEKVLSNISESPQRNISKQNFHIPQHISLNFYRDSALTNAIFDNNNHNKTATETNPKDIHFHAGERWQFSVKLKRIHTAYNPHGFDFEAWALSENMRAIGSINQKITYQKLSNFVFKPSYIVEYFREKIGDSISQILLNKPYAGIIQALVIGDDSQITQDEWNVYLRTGTNHLMSISGLHITMLASLAFALTALIWRRVPALVLLLATRKAATIVGLIVAILYACLAGLSVPTQRTLLMLLTFALALLVGRNLSISRALALALFVVVIIDPWSVIAPGFWLSFSAVAIIAYVSVGRLKTQHWLAAAAQTQWAITLGLLPLLIILFGQASVISPLANAFAIPVISLIVVPLSIIGALLSLDTILHAAYWVLDICMHGLNWMANLPVAVWQQAVPPGWAFLAAVIGVLWLLLPRGFPQHWLGLVLFLPLFLVKSPKLQSGEMQVSVLDVGQGLSVVVNTAQHTFLYDAGSRYSAQSDAGSRIVVPYLRSLGVTKLDGFVISHDDNDHSGGAASVLAQIPVAWLMTSFDLTTDSDKNSISQLPEATQLKCQAGQHWQWDRITFQVLHPTRESYSNETLKDNDRSCVIKISSAYGSVLLAGDIEKAAENELLQSTKMSPHLEQLSSDVLIVPHHGSKTSSTPDFIQAVNAKYAIFTVGYLNRFNHPKSEVEKRYVDSGAKLYRSDYNGAILLDFTAEAAKTHQIGINSWRQSQPRYWHDRYGNVDVDTSN